MASNRLHPVHLDCVTPWALLLPSGRAPAFLLGREWGPCAVEVIDCHASPEQFRQHTQLCAATRLGQTSSILNRALRRVAVIPTIYKALPPPHHQLHQGCCFPNRCPPAATTLDLTGGPPSRQTTIACRTALNSARCRKTREGIPLDVNAATRDNIHYLRRQLAEPLTAARLVQNAARDSMNKAAMT
jgi:hypothetical protein